MTSLLLAINSICVSSLAQTQIITNESRQSILIMAHTARNDDDKKEFFDAPDVLDKKIDQLVRMIKESKHMIAFTVKSLTL